VAAHGFSHRSALLQHFRAQTASAADDKAVYTAFRQAVKEFKAGGLDHVGLERAVLRKLRAAERG
jgi:hypothetical protein